jgi:hypothetical protein
LQGIDIDKVLRKQGPARAWNLIYCLVTDGMDQKKKDRFDSELFRKPPGIHRSGGDAVDHALQQAAEAYLKSLNASPPAIGL